MDLLSLLFPKYCLGCKKMGDYICANCFASIKFQDEDKCLVCNKPSIDSKTHPGCVSNYSIDGSSSALVYKSIVKKLVYSFKYEPNLTNLRQNMIDLLYEGLIQKESLQTVLQQDCVLVPIPLHAVKMRQRGYNQAKLLAEGLVKYWHIPIVDCLRRLKTTHSQYQLSRVERLNNLKGAFSINSKHIDKIKDKTILLVDDLITSGATMNEATKVLKHNGAQGVWGIAFAHGQ